MGVTGDSIVIKNNLEFERVENLKKGDILLNPYNKECIIEDIISYYSEDGFILKTENFFEINLDKKTEILVSKIENHYDEKNKKIKKFLYPDIFKEINDLSPLDYIGLNICKKNNILEEYIDKTIIYNLYPKIIIKSKLNNNNIIVLNNIKTKFKELSNFKEFECYIDKKSLKTIYIKDKKNILINDLKKSNYQRKINKDIFYLTKQEKIMFIENFLKENTEMYINNKQFRINIPSKIIALQLLYLIIDILEECPYVELIKKNNWSYKNVKASNKRNYFSVTLHPDLNKILKINNFFWQKQDIYKKNNRNIKYYKIITKNNESFYLYNYIIKESI